MNELSCNVKDCHYNRGNHCKKELITVEHSFSDATRCKSFQAKSKRDYTSEIAESLVEMPSLATLINCKVANCLYNQHYDCCAKNVEIVEQAVGESRCDTYCE